MSLDVKSRVNIFLNADKARENLDILQKAYEKNARALQKLRKAGDETSESYESLMVSQRAIKSSMEKENKSIDVLAMSYNELYKYKTQLNREFSKAIPNTPEYNNLSKKLKDVNDRLKDVRVSINDTRTGFEKMATKSVKISAFAVGGYNMVTNVLNKLINLTQEYLSLSDKFSDVQKTTGLSAEAVRELDGDLQKIDTRTSRQALLDLATDAGKLGISGKDDVLQFVKAADQIKVALGEDLGEGAIRNIGKMAEVFGLTKELGIEQSYLKIGSAINELGQSSSASESYLVDFTQRLSGVAAQSGISIENVMGYASAFDQSAQSVEVSATTMQNFIMKLFNEKEKFAKLAGKDVKEFTNLLNTDANQAVKDVLTAMNSKGGLASLAPMFNEMNLNGARSVGVLTSVATNIEKVNAAQQLANQAFAEGTSLPNEFTVKNNNDAAAADKRKKAIFDLKVALGEQLVPVLATLENSLIGVMRIGSALFSFLGNNIVKIGILSSAWAIYIGYLNLEHVIKAKDIALNKIKAVWLTAETIGVNLAALAHAKYTGNTIAATVATQALNTALKANPLGIVLGLLSAAVGIYSLFRGRTNEAAESSKQFHAELDKERDKVDDVFDALRKSEKGTKEYKTAKDMLISQYGKYLKGLVDEKGELLNIEDAYKRVNIAIEDNIARKKMAEEKDKIISDSIEDKTDVYEKMKSNLNILLSKKNPNKDAREINRMVKDAFDSIVKDIGNGVSPGSAGKDIFKKYKIDKNASTGFLRSTVADNMNELGTINSIQNSGIQNLENKYSPYLSEASVVKEIEVSPTENDNNYLPVGDDQSPKESLKKHIEDQQKILDESYQKIREAQMTEAELELENINKKYDDQLFAITKKEKELDELKKKGFSQEQEKEYQAFKENIQPSLLANEDNRELELKKALAKQEKERIELQESFYEKYVSDNYKIAEIEKNRAKELKEMLETSKKLGLSLEETVTTEKAITDKYDQQKTDLQDAFLKKNKPQKDKYEKLEDEKQESISVLDKEALDAGLMGTETYEAAKAEIEARYREQKKQLDDEAQKEQMAKVEAGLQFAQNLLGAASEVVSGLKEMELADAEMAYEREKSSYDEMLQSKTISQEEYDARVGELDEKRAADQKAIQKKYADAEFALKVSQIIVATALAAMQAYASMAAIPGLGAVAAGIATAAGLVQIGIAKKEHEKVKGYAQGGYTGEGDINEPAGIVHKGEYVVPKFVLKNPKALNYVQVLEAMRINKTTAYYSGGQVGTSNPVHTVSTTPVSTENTNYIDLLRSIDAKLSGVSLVYLKKQLDKIETENQWLKSNFGVGR